MSNALHITITYYQFIKENPDFTGCVIDKYGDKFWYLNGKYHRTDGPAVEFADGSKAWLLNGERLTEEKWTYTVRLNKLGEFLNGS